MLLTTTARKKTLFAGIHVSSRGIAGFTDQRTAFMRAQSAILQGPDFNLRVERARKIPYSRSQYLKNGSGDRTFLMQKLIQQQEQNACAKLKKKTAEWKFLHLEISNF